MNDQEIYNYVIEHFKSFVILEEADIQTIISKLEILRVRKKDFLLKKGETSNHMRFVAQGSLFAYTLDEKGNECVNQLCLEDWWINDLYSYFKNVPSKMFIQANEKSIIVRIHKNDLESLFKAVPALSEFWRIRFQNAYVALQEHVFENSHIDAYTRYKMYIEKYPTIEQRFPQYILASYLGMTVEYLSSLKKKNF